MISVYYYPYLLLPFKIIPVLRVIFFSTALINLDFFYKNLITFFYDAWFLRSTAH